MTTPESRTPQDRIISAAFDAFGLEEGKAILDTASSRMQEGMTLGDFGRLIEIVAIEREAARVVARRKAKV